MQHATEARGGRRSTKTPADVVTRATGAVVSGWKLGEFMLKARSDPGVTRLALHWMALNKITKQYLFRQFGYQLNQAHSIKIK